MKMSDATYSVRLPEELKDKIAEITKESGLTGKDFMADLVELYRLHSTKEHSNVFVQSELDELRQYMSRINGIYSNIVERTESTISLEKKKNQENLDTMLNEKIRVEEKLEEMKRALEESKELENSHFIEKEELQEQMKKAEVNYQTNLENTEALLEEYKEKNSSLKESLEDYNQTLKENKDLHVKLREMNDFVTTLKDQAGEKNRDIEKLEEQLQSEQVKREELKTSLEEKHQAELRKLQDDLNFKWEKKLFEQEKAQNQEKEEIKEVYNEKLQAVIDKYTEPERDEKEEE